MNFHWEQRLATVGTHRCVPLLPLLGLEQLFHQLGRHQQDQ